MSALLVKLELHLHPHLLNRNTVVKVHETFNVQVDTIAMLAIIFYGQMIPHFFVDNQP